MHCKFLPYPRIIKAPVVSDMFYHMKKSHVVVTIPIRRNAWVTFQKQRTLKAARARTCDGSRILRAWEYQEKPREVFLKSSVSLWTLHSERPMKDRVIVPWNMQHISENRRSIAGWTFLNFEYLLILRVAKQGNVNCRTGVMFSHKPE